MIRKTLSQMIAFLLSLFATVQAAVVQSPLQPAPTKLPIEVAKLRYKELKDGKHNIIVNWAVDGGGGVGFVVTKLKIEIELTDAKGVKQKVSKTLTDESAGSGAVSITPIPIPEDPVVGVPITDIFRSNIDPRDPTTAVLKFKVMLAATALSKESGTGISARRTITGVAQKEGTIQVIR